MTDWNAKYNDLPSLRFYDKLGVPYVVADDMASGPLWTGFCMMLDSLDTYHDIGFFHELAHWWIATEQDRKYPDFRLGRHVNATSTTFTSSAVDQIFHENPNEVRYKRTDRNPGWGEKTMAIGRATRQENFACVAMMVYEACINDRWEFPGVENVDIGTLEAFGVFNGPVHNHSTQKKIHEFVTDLGFHVSFGTVKKYILDYADWSWV